MRCGADVKPVGTEKAAAAAVCVRRQTCGTLRGPKTAGLTDVVDLRAAESNSVGVECAVTAEEREQVQ